MDETAITILLVEDNDDDAWLIAESLPHDRYLVRRISMGSQALEYLSGDFPEEVVLLDYKLPEMDGLEILRRLGDKVCKTAVVFLTIDTTIDTVVAAMRLGALDFYPKNQGYSHLSEVVEKVRALRASRLEARRFQDQLARSEEKYRSIFENMQDIYFEETLSGEILEISPSVERVLLYPRQEMIGANIHYFFYNRADHQNFLTRLATDKEAHQYEAYLRDKKGHIVICSINARLWERADAKGSVVSGTIRDISEYRRLENMFRQSQKMEAVGRFAGGISHDFNNLLTVIITSAELMKHRIADPEYLQQKVGVLLKTAESATELTRKLLTFSRRSVMNDSLVDISDVVSNFQSILNRFLGEDVVTRTAISRSSMLVRCDGAQIEQVLMNLVSNARDAMPGGGTLTISLERTERTSRNEALQLDPGEYAVLSVKDTGTGIPADVLDFIFEPFFSTKEERGTGLGLATVYGIVKQLGGAIEVQTEVGRGTEFILYFPISSVTTATLRTERPVPESPAAAGQGTILVVDDDPAVRQVIGQMLETLGYQSIEAESPQHALDFASENRPFDLALIDLVMPTIGGMELAVRLREKRPQLPILFMSGYSNKKLLESGVSDIDRVFIAKPFKRDFIAKKLNDLLIISSR